MLKLFDAARASRMRVGYVEFNDRSFRLSLSDADGGHAKAKRDAINASARTCARCQRGGGF